MNAKKNNGRSFLGTLFLVAVGFAMGFYHAEIRSAIEQAVQSISH